MSDYTPEQQDNHDELIKEPETALAEASSKKASWKKEVVDYMEIFVVSIAFVMLLFSFLFRICTVEGESMENTLFEGEKLIVSDLFYEPQSGDVIVFHQTGSGVFALNEPIVKRVIATEGETVTLDYFPDTMKVTITHTDGSQSVLKEPYMKYEGHQIFGGTHTYTVPEGHIFVLGDNRNNSSDSRYTAVIGMVDTRRVLGKVLFRATPLSRLGTVE